jgi:hypothetical protein
LIELNKIIENQAESSAKVNKEEKVVSTLAYPPNNGFTDDKLKKLKKLAKNKTLESALRKIIADATAGGIFSFLSLLDQTSDPSIGSWSGNGICLADITENYEESNEMLHDGLSDHYWEWSKLRKKDWKLDNLKTG